MLEEIGIFLEILTGSRRMRPLDWRPVGRVLSWWRGRHSDGQSVPATFDRGDVI